NVKKKISSLGYILMFYSDDPQNSIIQNKILTQWTWIGFYRDGWKWSDNTSVTSIKWSLFQPDNFGGNQYCARLISIVFSEFSGIIPGWFDDLLCADLHAFFCQSRKFNLVDLTSDVGKQ
uniref:C-type lectin domain-containing protein n=1 Tax=Astyanax mexicanus TaxID=7994 RepID=A0A3B1KFL9_ASTMX